MKSAKVGAVWGSSTWLIYSALEILFLTMQPLLRNYSDTVPGWHWKLIGIATPTYVLIGCASGFAFGFLARGWHPVAWRAGGPLALAIGFLLVQTGSLESGWVAFLTGAVALGVIVLILLGVRGDEGSWLARMMTDPLVVPVLLAGTAWVAELWSASRPIVVGAGSVAFLGGVAVLLAVQDKLLEPGSWIPWRHAAIGVLMFVAAAAGAIGVSQGRPDGPLTANGSAAGDRPNVVFIVLDTVRADHLSTYGYDRDTTPELTRFAASATLYRKAVATSNHTLPTHSSMFTGLHPQTHGAHDEPPRGDQLRRLDDAFQTGAETFAEHGYVTGAIAANWAMLGEAMGVMQGFDYLYALRPAPFVSGRTLSISCLREGLRYLLRPVLNTLEFDRQCYLAEEINAEADLFLDRAGDQAPLFLFLNYMDAHAPYLPPQPYADKYSGRGNFTYRQYLNLMEPLLAGEEQLSDADHEHLISQYDGALAYLDSQFRLMIDSLRERGLYDDALIIVVGDHGESIGERRHIGHWLTVYQNQIHVPLIIKYPGQAEGKVVVDVVSQVDLLPTMLGVAGIAVKQQLPGRDLRGPIQVNGFRAVSSGFRIEQFRRLHRKFGELNRSIVHHDFKLIAYADGSTELYNLATDPQEEHDISRERPELAQRLAGEIAKWAEETPRYTSTTSVDADPAQLERLKALGYVQ